MPVATEGEIVLPGGRGTVHSIGNCRIEKITKAALDIDHEVPRKFGNVLRGFNQRIGKWRTLHDLRGLDAFAPCDDDSAKITERRE